jgi:glycosyltransferase involved in cell wall biosynthesis
VSIITPVHNSDAYLLDCIDSVRNQSYPNLEHILIDDFSSDNSVMLIKKSQLKDNRIKLIQFKQNQGTGIARNKGIYEAKGRFIAFLDADDYWATNKLERHISFMIEYNVPFTYSEYYEFNANTKQVETLIKCPKKVSYNKLLINGGFIGCLTVIYDTAFFGKRYMPRIRKRQDWATWLKMLKEIDFAYGIQEPLAYYRKGNKSLSKSKLSLVKFNFMVYRKELGFSFLKSVCLMIVFLLYHFLFKHRWKELVKV